MFIKFSASKANYKQGQVFPLMIAIVAMMIIMAMVTANLGKLAIFKTDVSNAADAGALAGASILSGALLGFGLASDTECGYGVITTARALEILVLGRDDISVAGFMGSGPAGSNTSTQTFDDGSTMTTTTTTNSSNIKTTTTTSTNSDGSTGSSSSSTDDSQSYEQFPQDLIAITKLFILRMITFYGSYIKLMYDGKMAWANAKQTALKFAFQNAGVDEPPKKKFKDYGGSYDDYLNNYLIQEDNQSGFSRFMSHTLSGFWNMDNEGVHLEKINPKMEMPPVTITSGYGWSQELDESFSSSYPGNDYKAKDNYVEVKVSGSMIYPLEILTFSDYFGDTVVGTLTAIATIGAGIKYWRSDKTIQGLRNSGYGTVVAVLLTVLFAVISGTVFLNMLRTLPVGFTFEDEARTTTGNPLQVQVTRHKKGSNLGMWNFQYGDVVAKSAAHAFQQAPLKPGHSASDITIKPVLIAGIKDLGNFLGEFTGSLSASSFADPATFGTMIRGMMCMGALFAGGGLIVLLPLDIFGALLTFFFGYILYQQLCQDGGQDSSMTGTSQMFPFDNEQDAQEWFVTSLHLFETKLVEGFLQ